VLVAHAGIVGPVGASLPPSVPPPEPLLELLDPKPPPLLLLLLPTPPLLELLDAKPPLLLLLVNPPLLLLPLSELVVFCGSPGSAAQATPTHAPPVRNAKICPVWRYIEDLGATSED
jgi:hypothetical protein